MNKEILKIKKKIIKAIMKELHFTKKNIHYNDFLNVLFYYMKECELYLGENIEFRTFLSKFIKKKKLNISTIQMERIIRKTVNNIISNAPLDIKKRIFKLDNTNSISYVMDSILNYTNYIKLILENNENISIKEAIYHDFSFNDIKLGRDYYVDRMMFEIGFNPSFRGYYYFKKSILYYLEGLDSSIIKKVFLKDILYNLVTNDNTSINLNHLQKTLEMLVKNAYKDNILEDYKIDNKDNMTAYELISIFAYSIKRLEVNGDYNILNFINKEFYYNHNYLNISFDRINLFDNLIRSLNISNLSIDTIYFKSVFFLFLYDLETGFSPVFLNNILLDSANKFGVSDATIRDAIVDVSSLIPIDDLLEYENINIDMKSTNSLQIFFYKFSMYFKLLEIKFSSVEENEVYNTYNYCYDKKKLVDIVLVELGIQPTSVGYYYLRYVVFKMLECDNIVLNKNFFKKMADELMILDIVYIKWGIEKVYYTRSNSNYSTPLNDFIFEISSKNNLDSFINNLVYLINNIDLDIYFESKNKFSLVKKRTP